MNACPSDPCLTEHYGFCGYPISLPGFEELGYFCKDFGDCIIKLLGSFIHPHQNVATWTHCCKWRLDSEVREVLWATYRATPGGVSDTVLGLTQSPIQWVTTRA